MSDKARSMILASFIGDALALGVHWVYNTNVIDKKYGRVTDMLPPKLASFHRGKPAGAFTHYGDQAMLMLESVAAPGGFDLDRFAVEWLQYFESYEGYVDKATTATQDHFKAGKTSTVSGSESDDLGGPARMVPIIYRHKKTPDMLIKAVRDQTNMTHGGADTVDTAEFFARTILAVLQGQTPREALKNVVESHFNRAPFNEWVMQGFDSKDLESRSVINDLGQMCEIPAAAPATIHLIIKYQTDLETALVENLMAGGDSAARGLLTGAVLGAYHGAEAIPQRWLNDLKNHDRIVALLDKIDADSV